MTTSHLLVAVALGAAALSALMVATMSETVHEAALVVGLFCIVIVCAGGAVFA